MRVDNLGVPGGPFRPGQIESAGMNRRTVHPASTRSDLAVVVGLDLLRQIVVTPGRRSRGSA